MGPKKSDSYKKDFDQLNLKLDTILRRLEGLTSKKTETSKEIPQEIFSSTPETIGRIKKVKTEKKEVKKSVKKAVKKVPVKKVSVKKGKK